MEELLNLPLATDRSKIATIEIARKTSSAAYFCDSPYIISLIKLSLETVIRAGNTVNSAICYSYCAGLCCVAFQDVNRGVDFGILALRMAEKMKLDLEKPGLFYNLSRSVLHRKFSIRETLSLNREGYTLALDVGNLEDAAYNSMTYFCNAFWAGLPLKSLDQEARTFIRDSGHLMSFWSIYWQCVLNLLGFSEDPTILSGEAYQELNVTAEESSWHQTPDKNLIYIFKLLLGCVFGNVEEVKALKDWGKDISLSRGSTTEPALYFYESLAILSELSPSEVGNSEDWEQVEKYQLQLQQFWAQYAPMNYQHKVDLIEAEKCRCLDRKLKAIELYDKAIAGAKTNEYHQDDALANELAAKFYLNWGKEQIAASYMQQAYYAYACWGAKAKTDDLEKRYPHLLHSILQTASASSNFLDTLVTLVPYRSISSNSSTMLSSSSSLNTALDFSAILKAARSISSTLDFNELLAQLTGTILQNSGAECCALILPDRNGQWRIEAIATLQSLNLESQPLEGYPHLPIKLIQYVKNIRETVVIDALKTDLPILDSYLNTCAPQSLLAFPIFNQSNLTGIVYLENRQIRGVFNPERLLVLDFLGAQAAISLENARLYQQAQDYAQQLEQSYANPLASIQDNAEEIDLEFLREDLPKLLESMRGALDRIQSISNSLRTFSRADSENKVSANLHEGLDSTLLILKYRLKANEHRPAIEVVKDYGQIPEIECFPGQLNQVFMNLIANAIDALDEAAQQSSYQELEAQKQQIFLQTAPNEFGNAVDIRIRDNGAGIPESLQSKIFEHLFATKGVGKGTGLGLAIRFADPSGGARQIIVEKHGGTIEVNSELGKGTEFILTLPLR